MIKIHNDTMGSCKNFFFGITSFSSGFFFWLIKHVIGDLVLADF